MSPEPADRPFSVLLICPTYPPSIGGSEIEAQRISAELIRRGHRVQVVCAGGGAMPRLRDWVDPHGVPVRLYAGRWRSKAKDRVLAARIALMLLREHRRYDVVYFLMQGLQLAVGLPLARFLRKPVVMKISGSVVIPWMSSTAMGRRELRWLGKWAVRVLILNDEMKSQAIAVGLRPEQLEWMPNPVDTEEFSPCSVGERVRLRVDLGLPQDAPVVVYTGRLAPEKSLPSLLAAFAEVVKAHPRAALVLVGDGPMRPELCRLAVKLGLSDQNLRFSGMVAPDQVPVWLRAADIFTLVSPMEGFSCALAEAMACGLACLVIDIPANRQLVRSGENGLLVPVGKQDAITGALGHLIAHPALRARLGNAARELILAAYTNSQVARRYETLFHSILGRSEGVGPAQTVTAGDRR